MMVIMMQSLGVEFDLPSLGQPMVKCHIVPNHTKNYFLCFLFFLKKMYGSQWKYFGLQIVNILSNYTKNHL